MTDLATRTASTLASPDTGKAADLALRFLAGFSSANTRAAYGRDLRTFFEWCARHEVPVLGVTRSDLDVYLRSLEADGRTASTVARTLSTLAGFYRFAVDEETISRSPVERVRRPKVPQTSQSLGLDRDEARAFLMAAKQSSPRDHALACLLVLNGLRVTEACSLRVEDLGTEQGHRVAQVTRKGGNRERHAVFPRTADAVDIIVGARTEGPLLLDNEGNALDRHDAARIVRRLTKAAGIDKRISPHSLRHTAATNALAAGEPLHRVQDFLGHADPRTTRRYDRARHGLDHHATYALGQYLAE